MVMSNINIVAFISLLPGLTTIQYYQKWEGLGMRQVELTLTQSHNEYGLSVGLYTFIPGKLENSMLDMVIQIKAVFSLNKHSGQRTLKTSY